MGRKNKHARMFFFVPFKIIKCPDMLCAAAAVEENDMSFFSCDFSYIALDAGKKSYAARFCVGRVLRGPCNFCMAGKRKYVEPEFGGSVNPFFCTVQHRIFRIISCVEVKVCF